jgi:5-methylcytosine-specific restriction endonuclease McrA
MAINNLWKPEITPEQQRLKEQRKKQQEEYAKRKNKSAKKQAKKLYKKRIKDEVVCPKVKPHQKKIKQIRDIPLQPYSHPELGTDEYSKFFQSTAWRQLRYLALKNTEGTCQCCGSKASDGVQIHVDHIFPRSRYPQLQLSLDNIQVLCSDCNVGKGDWGTEDWRIHWKSI